MQHDGQILTRRGRLARHLARPGHPDRSDGRRDCSDGCHWGDDHRDGGADGRAERAVTLDGFCSPCRLRCVCRLYPFLRLCC